MLLRGFRKKVGKKLTAVPSRYSGSASQYKPRLAKAVFRQYEGLLLFA